MIFLGCLFSPSDKEEIFQNSKNGVFDNLNNFQLLVLDGLLKNGVDDLDLFSVQPVGIWPKYYKKIKLKSKSDFFEGCRKSEQIGCINLPFIKQHQRYRKLLKYLKQYKTAQDILIYSPQLFILKALSKLKVKHNIHLIVTDLPEYGNFSKKKDSWLRRINTKLIYKYLKVVDKYILLTKQMAEALKIEDKPYMVMEGICTSQIDNSKIKRDSKLKTIMYSGSLRYRFGIKNLLDAFSLIKDDNYRLILCGSGDMDDEINQLAKEDKRIIFKGYTRREEVLKLQRESTLLINPRQNNEEFTKYSFPSKTMEYMASGTPVLMYKLDGIPDEYNKYLNYVSDDTIEGLKNSIIKICERSEEKNIEQGKKAQKFVIEEKNNLKQAKRIIQFIKAKK